MKKAINIVAILVTVLLLLIGCNKTEEVANKEIQVVDKGSNKVEEKDNIDNIVDKKDDKENSKEEDKKENPFEKIDLSKKPNEAGQIMILMYHNIGKKESEWVRTVENFKRDLKVLYEKGYRPISLKDFVNNNIDVEAGYTPVVITFDDGNKNNFNIIIKDGKKIIDPDCAVGILEEFHEKHPDFPLEATFFVFGKNPFRQKEFVEYKLKYLVEKGLDIGNHTIGHNNFTNLNSNDIQKVIAENVKFLNGILKDYEVNTLALPYGSRPKNKENEIYLRKGEYDGASYNNIAILNVGWKPSYSPIDKRFNPYSLPRVRASEIKVDNVGLYNWLKYFDKFPEKRYISDGNPDIVTVPKKFEGIVDKNKLNGKLLYIYEEKE
ncbi:polysaccharide deacetylase family protein [Caloranaerobacter azorensis]|uniref:Polysaccharide deacetylase family protein n=1 Tax=Caloranaerobacter azorensis TaxID=116090 RepID=A0A6P1YF47_9FIRM|nr:polysaccharide deacetylase family protein [Caloranaerobacter azorensis]QIB26775.1 polysaccharide deacetylase family protein [Caloranaerobacter azorensis]